jgi:hypothetical protein
MTYNFIQLLHFVECDMMCYEALKAILTKAESRGQYRFAVLHNTSYCTK